MSQIRRHRQRLQLSQIALAAASGVAAGQISRAENGLVLRPEQLVRIAAVLGVPVVAL